MGENFPWSTRVKLEKILRDVFLTTDKTKHSEAGVNEIQGGIRVWKPPSEKIWLAGQIYLIW